MYRKVHMNLINIPKRNRNIRILKRTTISLNITTEAENGKIYKNEMKRQKRRKKLEKFFKQRKKRR